MRSKPLLIPLALAGCAGLAAQPVLAGPSGYPAQAPAYSPSVAVRVGAAFVEPDNKTVFSEIEFFIVDDPATEEEEAIPIDLFNRVRVDDDTTWYISGVWKPLEHWGLELYYANEADLEADFFSAATALPTETTPGEFIGEFAIDLGDFETSITSLYANWYPLSYTCLIQPYVGIGVTYVDIDQDFLRPVFRDEFGIPIGLVDFGSDFSWTAQVGVDINFGIDSAWQINASVMYVDAEPDLSLGFNTETAPSFFEEPASLPIRIRDEMNMDSWIFNLGVGYRFSL